MVESETTALRAVTVGVRFLLELAALGILGYWGYSVGQSQLVKLGLGIAIPLVVAAVWGLLGSPGAPYRLEYPLRVGLEILILGGAAVSLYRLDRPLLAVGFAVIGVLNAIFLYATGQS